MPGRQFNEFCFLRCIPLSAYCFLVFMDFKPHLHVLFPKSAPCDGSGVVFLRLMEMAECHYIELIKEFLSYGNIKWGNALFLAVNASRYAEMAHKNVYGVPLDPGLKADKDLLIFREMNPLSSSGDIDLNFGSDFSADLLG